MKLPRARTRFLHSTFPKKFPTPGWLPCGKPNLDCRRCSPRHSPCFSRDEPALGVPQGTRRVAVPLDKERVYARNYEVPAGGGVGTARAIAHAYSVFASGGKELGLREETLRQLMAPPRLPLKGIPRWGPAFSLGFMKPRPNKPFGSPGSFGMPGTGGSFGFADPQPGLDTAMSSTAWIGIWKTQETSLCARNVTLDRREWPLRAVRDVAISPLGTKRSI